MNCPHSGMRILVVDDNKATADGTGRVLRSAGYAVSIAYNGEEAVRLVRETVPDIVLLDRNLPDIEGLEVCRLIKRDERLKNSLVIFASAARPTTDDQVSGLDGGADGYIARPISNRELKARVDAYARVVEARRRMEEALVAVQASEERYRSIFETIQDAYIRTDHSGVLAVASPGAVTMFGYPQEELIGMPGASLYADSDERDKLTAALRESGSVRDWTARGLRKDGTSFWASMNVRLKRDSAGEVIGTEAVVRDITERKQAEEQRQFQVELQRIAAEVSTALSGSVSDAEFHQAVNTTLRRLGELLSVDRAYLFRFSEGADRMTNTHEWCAEGIESQMPRIQDQATDDLPWWKERMLEQRPVEIPDVAALPPEAEAERREFSSQDIRSLICLPTVGVRGHLSGFLGFDAVRSTYRWSPEEIAVLQLVADTIGNALERRRALEALAKSEEKYRTLFDQSAHGIYLHDLDGHILDVNEMACRQSGYDRDELLQMRVFDLHPDRAETVNLAEPENLRQWRQWQPGERNTLEAAHQRRDGAVYPVEVSTGVIWHDDRRLVLALVQDISRRKRAEEALRQSEKRHRRLFETMAQGVVYQAADGRIISANPAAERILGLTFDQMQGKTSMDPRWRMIEEDGRAVPGTDHPAMIALRTGETVGPVTRGVYRPDLKSHVWLRITAIPLIRPGETAPSQVYAAFEDITELKKADEALRKSEMYSRTVIEAIPDIVVQTNVEGEYLDILTGSEDMLFLPREELLGRRMGDVLPEHTAQLVTDAVREALSTRKLRTVSYQLPVPAGNQHFEARIVPLSEKEAIALVRDITELKRAEQEREHLLAQIRGQAQQMEEVLSSVPTGMILLDSSHHILLANPPARNDLTLLAGVAMGDRLTHLGERPLENLLARPSEGGWHELNAEGRAFAVITRATGEVDDEDTGWVVMLDDVTEERQRQARARRQDHLAVVGQLAGGIAHDFNNILAVISLYAEALARSEGLMERDRDRIAIIDEQVRHATRLIKQLLDFSRQRPLERQPLDLLPLLREQAKLLERTLGEHIEIVLSHGEDECVVGADLTGMQQIVMNLAVNARDAMPTGGVLRLALERIEAEPGTAPPCPGMEAGEWVKLAVSDTGSGIAPDVLPHLFEPFFTTREPGAGTGLGLAQVHGIVSQHEGHIGVETEVGKGTTFEIYLPALAVRPAVPPTPVDSTVPQGRGEVILVVEDNDTLRAALLSSLEQMNYRALEAANGEQALAAMNEQGKQVALVLSDVLMPVMGGLELVGALRQEGWETPVILLSGQGVPPGGDELQAQGVTAWLGKPPSLEQLASAIASALSG